MLKIRFLNPFEIANQSCTVHLKLEETFEKPNGIFDHVKQIADTTMISMSSLDFNGKIISKQTNKEIYDLSADEFWSLILGIHISVPKREPNINGRMQNFAEVKSYLTIEWQYDETVCQKCCPIIVMVQRLLNQLVETFMISFTNIVPYKLYLFISRITVP
jgi:hypothetical protein